MKYSLFAILLLIFAVNCSRSTETELETIQPNSADLYVFGTQNGNLCYWKNKDVQFFDGGNGLEPLYFGRDQGNIWGCAQNFSTLKYFFWKNGIKTGLESYLDLPAGKPFYLTDFQIDGGEILAGGFLFDPSAPPSDAYEYSVWRNGQKTELFKSSNSTSKVKILKDGNDIYVAADNGANFGYYKNFVFIPLNSRVLGFFKHQDEIYYDGYFSASDQYYYQKMGGNPIILPNGNFEFFSKDGNLNFEDGTRYYRNSLSNVIVDLSNTDIEKIIQMDVLKENKFMLYGYDSGSSQEQIFINDVKYMCSCNNQRFYDLIAVQN